MAFDEARLIGKAITFLVPFISQLIVQRIAAIIHRWAYQAKPQAKHVVVVGGSFAGLELAKGLCETLPTGYKCVFLERNSHFNYLFTFPRFSVLEGHERSAFIPYDGLDRNAPQGILVRVQDTVLSLTETHVVLATGEDIPYEYLVLATGTMQPLPAKVKSTECAQACQELQSVQQRIKGAQRIAIVGAGAVDVELASDIAEVYPQKNVVLIHSRNQILNQFGKRLHDYVMTKLRDLNIRVLLNERPDLDMTDGLLTAASLTFSNDVTEQFDLIIPCTGQIPNSTILRSLYPESISPQNSRILVSPTLQLLILSKTTETAANIFAFGDVAEHHGPRMARAAFSQSQVVLKNILSSINDKLPAATYRPRWDLEGAIKLTIGHKHTVLYCKDGVDQDSQDLIVPSSGNSVDFDVWKAWKLNGVAHEFPRKRNG
ncbi:FAD/NAD(P)-binding domain-containing protein [Polychaeton citri CBS 116435]|uniref:FAD/NAD(P)-binding domain-containing protein n=1 Tax=Polychaeton citri CBS 116435 TaxID=1314669 RepID=A0A9P4Q9X2_9PEZI|nr:FAD/NAD(P)-binding domain-containing protein [Polychaeton citri CBS 116435]